MQLFALRETPSPVGRYLLGLAAIAVVVLGWFLATLGESSEARLIAANKMPSPGEVAARVGPMFGERDLLAAVLATLRRVFLGFGLAIIVGVPLGIIAGSWRAVQSFLAPLVLFGRNAPIAALIPLTLFFFGIDESQKIGFIYIATVPFVFSDAAAAVIAIPERFVETAKTLGANSRQIVTKVLLPLALPDIVTGLRYLFGLAFGYIMLAEMVNATTGLGSLLNVSRRLGLIADIWVILIVIALLAYILDRIFHFFQKGIFPYRTDL